MALKQPKSLKDIFQDLTYAWDLLEAQVKLETSEIQSINGEDISKLLQLYMRGVEKMNTLVDLRESFFKNRVTNLMSRPIVIKILNKPMTKKNQPAVAICSSPQNLKSQSTEQSASLQSPKKLDAQKQLQLKQKKQSLEMRLAYSAEENNPDALKKMLAQHSEKQTILSSKIQKIVDSHQQKLKKRIGDRKMRTLTAKAKSEIVVENQIQFYGNQGQIEENIVGINIFDIATNTKNQIANNSINAEKKTQRTKVIEQPGCKNENLTAEAFKQKKIRKRNSSVQQNRIQQSTQKEGKKIRKLSLDNKQRKHIDLSFLNKIEKVESKVSNFSAQE